MNRSDRADNAQQHPCIDVAPDHFHDIAARVVTYPMAECFNTRSGLKAS